ncbi:MAG: DNA-deoxyinosine glycosylase [Lachnospiraceae bacterium]|nr:DNA-deoxyinosine glycosylase [Lachnospiraceae bacterium]
MERIQHPIPPLFDAGSRALILGSFPSVKSREQGFFYGHAQNRFWRVISALAGQPLPQTIPEKRQLILSSHLALWDVIASCEIVGSSDSSISHVIANDLSVILEHAQVRCIFLNGRTAEKYFYRYNKMDESISVISLPSTSPANAAWSFERLCEAWGKIWTFLD